MTEVSDDSCLAWGPPSGGPGCKDYQLHTDIGVSSEGRMDLLLATSSASIIGCSTSGLLTLRLLACTLTHAVPSNYRLNVSCLLHMPDTEAQGESRVTGLAAHSVPASRTGIPVSTVQQKHSDVCKHHQT